MIIQSAGIRTKEIAYTLLSQNDFSEFASLPDMGQYRPPQDVDSGSLEHVLFITLTLTLDNLSDSAGLWRSSRSAYENPDTRYLFSPDELCQEPVSQIAQDLKKCGIPIKKSKDAEVWKMAGESLFNRWNSDPLQFIRSCDGNIPEILDYMKPDQYNQNIDFPKILGNKKGYVWIKLLRHFLADVSFSDLNKTPFPVDIHIVRATIALGLLYGKYSGQLGPVSQKIQDIWFSGIDGDEYKGVQYSAFDIPDYLRSLSKNGCMLKDGKRSQCPRYHECPMQKFCIQGIFSIENNALMIDTSIPDPAPF